MNIATSINSQIGSLSLADPSSTSGTGANVGSVSFAGYNTAGTIVNTASITATPVQSFNNASGYGTDLKFSTTVTNSTGAPTEVMRISATGNYVGINTTTPTTTLTVGGNMRMSSQIVASNLGIYRNKIINGNMFYAQRYNGVTVSRTITTTGQTFTLDRWEMSILLSAGTLTITQNALTISDTPYLYGFLYCSRLTVTSGITYSYLLYGQAIEYNNIQDLNWGTSSGSAVTISFWARTNAGNNVVLPITLRNFASNTTYTYNTTFTLTTSGTWQYVTATIPAPPVNSEWGWPNAGAITLVIGGIQSSTPSPNSWYAGNYFGVSGNTNIWGTTGNYLDLTGVQFEKSTFATPFEFRNAMIELQLCQRYFEIVFSSTGSLNIFDMSYGSAGYVGYFDFWNMFRVTKRTFPTLYAGSVTSSDAISATYRNKECIVYGSYANSSYYITVTSPFSFDAEILF